jgi:isopentenyl phosphate kinase
MTENLVFLKLGGSLITDKRKEATPHPAAIRRLAAELREALDAKPDLKVLLGHGSGSFGHWEASQYGTRQGVETPDQWGGFARVSAAASRLNRIVVDAFLEAGVPVLSLQPSASALANAGTIVALNEDGIRRALDHDLVPLVFGDVAFDRAWGGTILSTEDLFVHLAEVLHPERVLLLGNASGVMGSRNRVIRLITPENYPQVEAHLRGAAGADVTGGMADKVKQMVNLVQRVPGLQVWIFTGREHGNLKRALLEPENTPGTRISET